MAQEHSDDTGKRRAAVACDYCRRRKRRCDGAQPACALCATTHRVCRYSDSQPRREEAPPPAPVSDGGESSSTQRMSSLESLVHTHSSYLAQILSQLPALADPTLSAGPAITPSIQVRDAASLPAFSPVDAPSPAMTIPIGHLTTVATLLALPAMQDLLGPFEEDLFTHTEAQRALPADLSLQRWDIPLSTWPHVDQDWANRTLQRYFSTVHLGHPVLDQAAFFDVFLRCREDAFAPSLNSALCLIVFALAEVSESTPDARELAEDTWAPGSSYFRPAVHYLLDFSMNAFGSDELLPPALYLCAVYFSFLARPLQAWKMVHLASTHVQQVHRELLRNRTSIHNEKKADRTRARGDTQLQQESLQISASVRTAWAIFVLESNLLAEHHLPRSGIEHLVETMSLPMCEHALWLSEISIRRLLNRVHYNMYESGPASRRVAQLPPLHVATELLRQLDEWYQMLPPNIIPPAEGSHDTMQSSHLPVLLRYHSAREVICRPFLLHGINSLGSDGSSTVSEMAQSCIESATRYLQTASEFLKEPSASTEIVIQSTFAVTIVLTMAHMDQNTFLLVSSIRDLQNTAIRTLQRWSFSGSCIESMLWILQNARYKSMPRPRRHL